MITIQLLSYDNKIIGNCIIDALDSVLSRIFQCKIHARILPKSEDTVYNEIDCITDNDRFYIKALL